jgi:Domain of unknown function (DUF4331)
MSHHFDTPTALEDPRINVCDYYLFRGRPGMTVMAMTVNPDAGLSAPDTFREEGLYAFRFDLDGDAREEVAFKVTFGSPTHANHSEHKHVQTFEVRRCFGHDALKGFNGDLLVEGRTGEVTKSGAGIFAFAGLAPDLFAGDAAALGAFRTALYNEEKFAPAAFENTKNFFAKRNVTAIVLELPSQMIGRGLVHGWATASLFGHAPEVQVSRWGLPLITNFFMPDAGMKEDLNRVGPSEDLARFSPQIGKVVEQLVTLAQSSANPSEYAKQIVARFCPATLPYELDTEASFNAMRFNGRALTDDVMDVILALATNTQLGDGVAPDRNHVRRVFPYFGDAFTSAEQAGVGPARPRSK